MSRAASVSLPPAPLYLLSLPSVLTADFGRRRVFVLPATAAVFHLREAFWFLLTVVSCEPILKMGHLLTPPFFIHS